MSDDLKKYTNAKSACSSYGGKLAIPNSADEYYFINNTVTLGTSSYVYLSFFFNQKKLSILFEIF